jgi:hypothetical protein
MSLENAKAFYKKVMMDSVSVTGYSTYTGGKVVNSAGAELTQTAVILSVNLSPGSF